MARPKIIGSLFAISLVVALAAALQWAAAGWLTDNPPIVRYPWLRPAGFLGTGVVLVLCAIFYERLPSLTTPLLLPLSLLACIGLNGYALLNGHPMAVRPRLATNSAFDLFRQTYDAFENFPLYVLLSKTHEGKTLIVAPGALEELKAAPWELLAYGRLARVVTRSGPATLSDQEAEKILRRPHLSYKSQLLGFKDGRYYSYVLTYILIEDAGSTSPLCLARHGREVIIGPVDVVPCQAIGG